MQNPTTLSATIPSNLITSPEIDEQQDSIPMSQTLPENSSSNAIRSAEDTVRAEVDASEMPVLVMNRKIFTVPDAWNEYFIDSFTASFAIKRSIRFMEETYGTNWRKSNTDTQFFIRREPLWKAIILASEDSDYSRLQIANALENSRKSEYKTLRKLCTTLKKLIQMGKPNTKTKQVCVSRATCL
jgi:hypothetical protein